MLETPTQVFDLVMWEEKYKPIKNHLDDNASFDGIMFETYGEELAFVKAQAPDTIWTYGEEDDKFYIQAGWHYVNRLGYFITEVPFEDDGLCISLSADDEEVDAGGKLIRLSYGASVIYEQVLNAMQEAEEMGGVKDDQDYINLMQAIVAECEERAAVAALNSNPATLRAFLQSS
ncbi:hypothetical protein UFOVP26_33 [uncultured Caudovirales phage]|uniref:Uncharacterized protein n=1 Tax=uncultured Caudovirales phage TaxID=2100421 RepID=A0A6J7WR07_9CAUD|nr:hypothetical protein UFOVP26_33 [uncultured Caudovirales phage]CAB4123832.1 hypothetical protein UFOVP44_64 [uncultured Caudovirales phage]CAB5219268.1 hypothetical protein UFOVP220_55 [uncultured Caudovirales phage]